jgi:hypothetical protein
VDARAVVLVEGISDQLALTELAVRRGRDLAAEGVSIVPIGGAQSIGKTLKALLARDPEIRVAGLCDVGEARHFQRAFERAGIEQLGFFVCEPDLEAELIDALGIAAVEQIVEAQGDLSSFRTLQKQPAWRGRPIAEQLRRFMGSGGSRKIRYAPLLVQALPLTEVPRPLDSVLAHV